MAHLDLDNIRVLTHSCIRIQSAAGTVIYFDPYQLTEAPHDADFVLVTHAHYDHFSPEDIERVANDTTELVVPASMADEATPAKAARVHTMQAGEHIELADMVVNAVPAYNVEPERLGFHPRENAWIGYIVTIDGTRVYVAGDTDQNPDTLQVSCDIALIPIGGTYTMDPHQAAAFINRIMPRIAIPTHYGSIVGTMDDAQTFADEVDRRVEVVLKLER